jgi:hypothetical protein
MHNHTSKTTGEPLDWAAPPPNPHRILIPVNINSLHQHTPRFQTRRDNCRHGSRVTSHESRGFDLAVRLLDDAESTDYCTFLLHGYPMDTSGDFLGIDGGA